jgi:hypothetical protein
MTTVNVTQAHIYRGVPGDPCACPVALAVRDVFPRAKFISIGASTFAVKHSGSKFNTYYDIPRSVASFILAFDGLTSGTPAPFSFQLTEEA